MIYFGVATIIVGVIFALSKFRDRGLSKCTVWFVLSSVVFVNLAYILFYGSLSAPQRFRFDYGIFAVSLGLLAFIVGSTISLKTLGQESPVTESSFEQIATSERQSRRQLVVLAAVMFVPSWAYFVFLGYVPLFEGVSAVRSTGLDGLGTLQASRLSRDPYASENGTAVPFQGVMQITRNLGVPMVAALAITQINAGRRRGLRVVILALSVVTVLLAGQRWPLIYIIIAMVAAFMATAPKQHLGRVVPLAGGLGIIGVFISVLQGRTRDDLSSWGDAIVFGVENLIQRILYEQSLVPMTSYLTEAYDRGELMGRSYYDSLAAYLPGPGASFSVEFYQTVTGDWRAYTAPPDFYTEALLNFDYIGVVIVCLIWGIFLRWVDDVNMSVNPEFNGALKSGLCAILASSVFTGPVFTLSGLLLVIGSKLFVEWLEVREERPHLKMSALREIH